MSGEIINSDPIGSLTKPARGEYMNFIEEFKGLSTVKKIGLIASITGILGFGISLVSSADTVKQTINGDKNTVIGENKGSITINYGDAQLEAQRYVLRNRSAGISLIVSEPDISAATDKSKHVCNALAGTPIKLTGKSADMSGVPMWKEVIIQKGECAGKKGWASTSVISFE